jgi:peptidoglycan/xylan/chitin deacetylase (PgdA/CDA1 family)
VARRRHLELRPATTFATVSRHAFGRIGWPKSAARGLGIYAVATAEPVFALTVDDGPSPLHTPGLLDVLDEHGAKATFFVLARPATKHPEIVRDALARGHEVGLHGGDHRSLLTMSPNEAIQAVVTARREVEAAIGAPITLYRPPYGHHTWKQGRGLQAHGLEIVQWTGDATDWLDDDATAIAERLSEVCAPGSILLIHDDRADPETLGPGERLPTFDKGAMVHAFLNAQDAAGLASVTVSELLARGRSVRSTSKDGMSWR